MLRTASRAVLRSSIATTLLVSSLTTHTFAHATFEVAEAKQNSYFKATLRVPHGCDGEATKRVRIAIPEGMIAVKPMPKPGWTLSTTSGDLSRSHVLHGKEIKTGVKEIVWSGGNLADDHYDEFVFQARITDQLPAGETVFVPVTQECDKGKAAWIEIPAKGQDPHDLKSPAPGIRIVAAKTTAGAHDHHGQGAAQKAEFRAGSLTIGTPWARETPTAAKVGGGYMTIANSGKEADRLIGGSFAGAGAFEVHEMRMEGTMMKMRALDKGLEIKPGETVELKPGGYHVMFLGLKQPLKAGESLKGELVFEKAGRVAVEYRILSRQENTGAGHDHGNHHGHGGKSP